MNERAIRELKGMLSKVYNQPDTDEEERMAIEDAIEDLDKELIEKSRKAQK
jgi:hypothetical protein